MGWERVCAQGCSSFPDASEIISPEVYEHLGCWITGVLGDKRWDFFCPITEVTTFFLPCLFVYYFSQTIPKLYIAFTIWGCNRRCYRKIKFVDTSPPTCFRFWDTSPRAEDKNLGIPYILLVPRLLFYQQFWIDFWRKITHLAKRKTWGIIFTYCSWIPKDKAVSCS